jgi:hypothetical protein
MNNGYHSLQYKAGTVHPFYIFYYNSWVIIGISILDNKIRRLNKLFYIPSIMKKYIRSQRKICLTLKCFLFSQFCAHPITEDSQFKKFTLSWLIIAFETMSEVTYFHSSLNYWPHFKLTRLHTDHFEQNLRDMPI